MAKVRTAGSRADEEARLAAVRRYGILDTPADVAFDRLTVLAARLFGVSVAIIGIVDRDRIWFKSHHGVDVDQIGRDGRSGASAVMQTDSLVVSDATADPHAFASLFAAATFRLGFYAAVPLTTFDGFNLGALCIIDQEPRELTGEELATLKDLAAIVVDELELRLAACTEDQRQERARADFVATVSHELKTPLAAVYGAALLLTGDGALDEETRERLMAVIAEQGARLRDSFENLLTSSQLESGSFRIVLSELNPDELARTASEAARIHLPSNLRIEVDVRAPLPAVYGDTTRVRQILENLLDNAIKYSPAGGRIDLLIDADDQTIRFRVRDEGLGVPESEHRRIFGRYFRLDSDRHRATGTGLGLYVSEQLANQMGGRIELDSYEGEGSTFTLALPLQQSVEPTAAA